VNLWGALTEPLRENTGGVFAAGVETSSNSSSLQATMILMRRQRSRRQKLSLHHPNKQLRSIPAQAMALPLKQVYMVTNE
jgi:hypothetical protein